MRKLIRKISAQGHRCDQCRLFNISRDSEMYQTGSGKKAIRLCISCGDELIKEGIYK